jgi:hypothetical protein
MRCLLAADLHYSLQQFDWVKEVAEYFDIVVLAGITWTWPPCLVEAVSPIQTRKPRCTDMSREVGVARRYRIL